MKSKIALAGALLASTFTLAACDEAEAPVEQIDGIAGLEVSNARLVLAPVAGNPAAVYFDLAYSGDRAIAIRGADVAGAKSAMIHQYAEYNFKQQMVEAQAQPLKKGDTLSFEPGALHVMAMDVSPDLKAGGNTEVTLTIAGGDKHSFDAEILAAGDER